MVPSLIPYWKRSKFQRIFYIQTAQKAIIFPQSHRPAVLCSVVKCNDTIANNELWLRTQKAKQISYTGTLQKSQLKGDLEHIVLTQCSQISNLHSLSQKRHLGWDYPSEAFRTGSVIHAVSHGEGEAPGRARKSVLHKDAWMSMKSHLVIQRLHRTLSPVPWHDMSGRGNWRPMYRITDWFVARQTGGHSSALSICDAETAVGEWKKSNMRVSLQMWETCQVCAPVSERAGVRLHVTERFVLEIYYILLLKGKN